MRLSEVFDEKRPVKGTSIAIGLSLGIYFVLDPSLRHLPPVAGIVVPFGWILLVEYASRFMEWLLKKGIPIL